MSDIEISVQNSVLMNPENILADIEYAEEAPDGMATENTAIISSRIKLQTLISGVVYFFLSIIKPHYIL